MHDFVNVRVLKWSRWNPRRDCKKHSWFRLENDLLERGEFFHFTHADFVVMLYVFSQRSKKISEGVIKIYYQHILAMRQISRDELDRGLEKLRDLGIVLIGDEAVNFIEREEDDDENEDDRERDTTERTDKPTSRKKTAGADRASATKVFDVSFSKEYQEFVKALEDDGFKPTPAQRRKLATAFTEWKQDLEAIREFISSKYKYAKTTLNRSESEATRYALNAFIGEATA